MKTKAQYFAYVGSLHQACVNIIAKATYPGHPTIRFIKKALGLNPAPPMHQDFSTWMDAAVHTLQMSSAEAAIHYCWDRIPEELKERCELVAGVVGAWPNVLPHMWIKVDSDPEVVEDLRQGFIIDIAGLGVHPSCLKIHESSPLFGMYYEDKDC